MVEERAADRPAASLPAMAEIHWIALAVAQVLRIPLNVPTLLSAFPPPHHEGSLAQMFSLLKLRMKEVSFNKLRPVDLPAVALLAGDDAVQGLCTQGAIAPRHAVVLSIDDQQVLLARQGKPKPRAISHADFVAQYQPKLLCVGLQRQNSTKDEDSPAAASGFGLDWLSRGILRRKG